MSENTPVIDTLLGITAVSVEQGILDAHEHMLARLAALVAVDAPTASYLLNLGTAADAGVTLKDVQGCWSWSPRSSARPGSYRRQRTSPRRSLRGCHRRSRDPRRGRSHRRRGGC